MTDGIVIDEAMFPTCSEHIAQPGSGSGYDKEILRTIG